jgi:hypothetical protein
MCGVVEDEGGEYRKGARLLGMTDPARPHSNVGRS